MATTRWSHFPVGARRPWEAWTTLAAIVGEAQAVGNAGTSLSRSATSTDVPAGLDVSVTWRRQRTGDQSLSVGLDVVEDVSLSSWSCWTKVWRGTRMDS